MSKEYFRIKKKYYLLTVGWFVSTFTVCLLLKVINEVYVLAIILVLFFSFGSWITNLRCPKCSQPILLYPSRAFYFKTITWNPIVPGNCWKCGHEFR